MIIQFFLSFNFELQSTFKLMFYEKAIFNFN